VAILFTPIAVFTVKPGGRNLEVRTSDASVLDKERRHVVVLPELLGGVLDSTRYLKLAAFVETT
jgi:hypothetical protein